MKKRIAVIVLSAIIFTSCAPMDNAIGKPPNPSVVSQSETSVPEELTDEDAASLLSVLIPHGIALYGRFNGAPDTDISQTIPGSESYALVTDDSVKTIAELKTAIEAVFTKECAEWLFYARYLDVPESAGLPLYKEYGGRLYANADNGGHGYSIEWFPEQAHLVYQCESFAEVIVPVTVYDDPDNVVVIIAKTDGEWLIAAPLLY